MPLITISVMLSVLTTPLHTYLVSQLSHLSSLLHVLSLNGSQSSLAEKSAARINLFNATAIRLSYSRNKQ